MYALHALHIKLPWSRCHHNIVCCLSERAAFSGLAFVPGIVQVHVFPWPAFALLQGAEHLTSCYAMRRKEAMTHRNCGSPWALATYVQVWVMSSGQLHWFLNTSMSSTDDLVFGGVWHQGTREATQQQVAGRH